MAIRVTQAAKILGVSAGTIRNYCKEGKLPYKLNAAGQKIFDPEELQKFHNQQLGITDPKISSKKAYYIRSSDGNDITMETQLEKLESEYGKADYIFKDKASGLNENRHGLQELMKLSQEQRLSIYVTDKDRLTRFGWSYLEAYFKQNNCELITLNSLETKEPHEVLLNDFMALFASFSGKFYRLRGWNEQKKFLNKVTDEVNRHGS